MRLEVLCRRLVSAHLHVSELVPLPEVEIGTSHKGNVNPEVSVVGAAVEAKVDRKRLLFVRCGPGQERISTYNRRPGRVLCSAVKT